MPSGPSLFDDEDAERDHAPSSDDVFEPTPIGPDSTRTPLQQRDPNFRRRRAIVAGTVVAVVAITAIVISRVIGSGSDGTALSGTIDAEWNRVVLVDERTGRVIIDDDSGKEIARIESDLRSPTASRVIGPTLLVTAAETTVVVDLDAESATPFELGDGTIVQPAGSTLTMVAVPPTNDRGVLVHGPTGDTIDTDALDPMVGARYEFGDARTDPAGRDVLVTDSGNFQSVLFSFDRDAPSFFPGLALAVGDSIVVTAQNVGTDATVSVFDHDGAPIATGRTPSVRAAMITEKAVLLATVDGDLLAMDPSSGDTETLAALDVGTVRSGDVTPNGDRFVVTGTEGTVIVDAGGTIVESFDGQFPAGDDPAPRGARCITLRDDASTSEQRISVIDTTDGSVLAEAVADEPTTASADGCVIGSSTAKGYDVLSIDGVDQITNGDTLVALAPDGASVIVERGNRIQLVTRVTPDTDDSAPADDSEPVDLGPRGRSVGFFRS